MITKRVTKVRPFFNRLYLWVGAKIDTRVPAIYICPLPTIGLRVWRETVSHCPECGHEAKKVAYLDIDGWYLSWHCGNSDCIFWDEEIEAIEWPFGPRSVDADEMRDHGYEVV